MVEIGPTDDQKRMLEKIGLDPKCFEKIPRDQITKRLSEYLSRDWAKINAEKSHRGRMDIIRDLGLSSGTLIFIQDSGGYVPGVINKITPEGYIEAVDRKNRIRPQRIRKREV